MVSVCVRRHFSFTHNFARFRVISHNLSHTTELPCVPCVECADTDMREVRIDHTATFLENNFLKYKFTRVCMKCNDLDIRAAPAQLRIAEHHASRTLPNPRTVQRQRDGQCDTLIH